jgi:hypothetical protein
MFKYLKFILLALSVSFLSACVSQPPPPKVEGVLTSDPDLKNKLVSIELYVIKLYSDKYTDSGVLSNDISTALKTYKGSDLSKLLATYGKTAVETKIPMIQVQNFPSEYILANSTGYVADIKDGKLITDFFNDGFRSKIASNIISSEQIAVRYNVQVERVLRIDKDKSNKLIEIPIMVKKSFEQSMVFVNNEYIVAGVINTLPKQFEIVILKANIR